MTFRSKRFSNKQRWNKKYHGRNPVSGDWVLINSCSTGRVLFYSWRHCLYCLSSQTLLNNQPRTGMNH